MITPRLEAVKKLVTKRTVADIGTDHAYIPISLLRENICDFAIAADIKKGPLEIAAANIKKYGLCDKIETRLGNGLSVLEAGETDEIIIAGMGGFVISEILRAEEKTAKESGLILQPMNCQYELRKYLFENGYRIEKEELALEGFKIYNMMYVSMGQAKKYDDELSYHLPPELYSHTLFIHLFEKKKREFTKILTGQKNSVSPDYEVIDYYEKLLKAAERIM